MGKYYILGMMSKGHCSCLTSFEDIGKTHSMRNGDLTSLDNEFTLPLLLLLYLLLLLLL